MKILLVEDEAPIREVVKRGLEESGMYHVDTAEDGTTGLDLAWDEDYALIILDIMLPGIDGWTICERLRNKRISTPILMLTARDGVRDRVRGLEIGADDYLPKPFDFEELLARVRALIRRDKLSKGRVIRIGHLEMDTTAHRVFCDGKEVNLTSREYSLLEALASNEGRVLSREAIQYRIWNNEDSMSNTVDVYIRMLRRKIDADRPVKLIHTVHGLGYMLKRPNMEQS
ncbi:response regulator transcription factor [bacterium]|nr:response regulator transcription factor [bacterium]